MHTSDTEHTAITADPDIVSIGTLSALNLTLGQLTTDERTRLQNTADALRCPIDDFDANTLLRVVLRRMVALLRLTQNDGLGEQYPDVDLDTVVSDLTLAQRNALRSWAAGKGFDVSDVPANATLRTLLKALFTRNPTLIPWRFRLVDAANATAEFDL